jgi:thiol:disulfide interchange protein DsbC
MSPAEPEAVSLADGAGRTATGLAVAVAAALLAATSPAQADEAAIRKALEPSLGRIDAVTQSPVAGVWEVVTGAKVQYTDGAGRFVFDGPLREAATGRDLTAQRQYALLPLKLALKQTRGSGRNVLVTFEDPNCGYCKKLAKELVKVPDLTLYTFVYPILGADSQEKARNIWCAADPAAAWNAQMLEGKAAPAAKVDCDQTGLQKVIQTARQLGIRGTPYMMLEDGEPLRGFVDAAKLEERFKGRKALPSGPVAEARTATR